jgi:hypothetical protein
MFLRLQGAFQIHDMCLPLRWVQHRGVDHTQVCVISSFDNLARCASAKMVNRGSARTRGAGIPICLNGLGARECCCARHCIGVLRLRSEQGV